MIAREYIRSLIEPEEEDIAADTPVKEIRVGVF